MFESIGILGIGAAIVVAIFGWLGITKRMATKRAEKAEEEKKDLEQQVRGAQAVTEARDRADKAVAEVRSKPLRGPSDDRSDFEGP